MTTEQKHAPLPWKIEDPLPKIFFITDANGESVPFYTREILSLIVESVNGYSTMKRQRDALNKTLGNVLIIAGACLDGLSAAQAKTMLRNIAQMSAKTIAAHEEG